MLNFFIMAILDRSTPYWILLCGSLVWILLIFVPLLDSLDGSMRGSTALVYLFFKPICHQQPERCFWLAGIALPVCARCLGVYLGAAWGIIAWGLVRGPRCTKVPGEIWIGLGLMPLALDGLLNAVCLINTPSLARAGTGFLAGATLAAVLAAGCASLFSKRPALHFNHNGATK